MFFDSQCSTGSSSSIVAVGLVVQCISFILQ